MQVSSIKTLERKGPLNKARKASAAGVFSVTQEDEGAQEIATVASMHSIQSILSLQTTYTELGLEEINYKAGENLLEQMDTLLNATLTENQADKAHALSALAGSTSDALERSSNSELEDLIDAIKLRAAVELAKNRRHS